MDLIPSEMFRGHLDTIILLSLVNEDKHTNQIREEIEKRSDGKFELKQGTFYSCLQRIVKQGYVVTYRVTSPDDGSRRKFYQLTQKGKTYIDNNKGKWTDSREVINILLETPQEEEKKPKPLPAQKEPEQPVRKTEVYFDDPQDVEKQLSDFLNSPDATEKPDEISAPDNNADVVVRATKSDEMSSLSNDPNVRIIDLGVIAKTEAASSSESKPPVAKNEKSDISDDKAGKDKFKADSASEFSNPEIFDLFNLGVLDPPYNSAKAKAADSGIIASEKPTDSTKAKTELNPAPTESKAADTILTTVVTSTVEVEPSEVISETAVGISPAEASDGQASSATDEVATSPSSAASAEEKQVEKKEAKANEYIAVTKKTITEEDDFIDGDTVPAVNHNYKTVLQKMFPQKHSEKRGVKEKPSRESSYREGMDVDEYFDDNDSEAKKKNNATADDYQKKAAENNTRFSDTSDGHAEKDNTTTFTSTTPEVPLASSDGFDFSDIKQLAKAEGFKVNISTGIEKRKVNSILINKLVAVSSWVFYIFVVCEITLLAHFTASAAGLTQTPFWVVALIIGVFPVVALITYFVDPKRTVSSLPTMKYIIELCIVIMLNLVLITLVFAILAEIDFSDVSDLLRYILYPAIVILNVPVYFIIKYLNLTNKRYYNR